MEDRRQSSRRRAGEEHQLLYAHTPHNKTERRNLWSAHACVCKNGPPPGQGSFVDTALAPHARPWVPTSEPQPSGAVVHTCHWEGRGRRIRSSWRQKRGDPQPASAVAGQERPFLRIKTLGAGETALVKSTHGSCRRLIVDSCHLCQVAHNHLQLQLLGIHSLWSPHTDRCMYPHTYN